MKPWIGLILLLLALPATAESQQYDEGPERLAWTVNLYVENDLFSETDQDYTSGIRVSVVSPDITSHKQIELWPWIQQVNEKLTFFHDRHDGLQRNVIASIGQQIYTPQDLAQTALIEDDRPYAAWLFLGLGYQTRGELIRADKEVATLDTLELRLGVVGPAALGKQAQDVIHDLRGFERFLGWDNQLRNEPGFVAVWEHKRKTKEQDSEGFGWDAIWHAGIALGNVRTHVNAGGEFRAGWWIPNDFGTSAIRPGGENSTPSTILDQRQAAGHLWGFHVFASFDARLVAQDIFLDGNTFKTSHRVAKEVGVADAAVGFSLSYGRGRLSYAHIFRSREFARQDGSHAYGSLAFSYTRKI